MPEYLREPNGISRIVKLITQYSALPPSKIVSHMRYRLSKEKKRLRKQWRQENGTQQIDEQIENNINKEINLLKTELAKALRSNPYIWNSCQKIIENLEVPGDIDDIYSILLKWNWEKGLHDLWKDIYGSQSYEILLRYEHPLLAIEKLVGCLEEPESECIEQLIWNLLHTEGKPGAKTISGWLTGSLRHAFSELAWLLEQFVNNQASLMSAASRNRILCATEQLVAGLPGEYRNPHFQVQDLAWRAVLLDKAGKVSYAVKLATEALQHAQPLTPGNDLFMWHSRLGDAHRIVAKSSRDTNHVGWSQSDIHYSEASKLKGKGKVTAYIRQAEARVSRLELFVDNPTEEIAYEMSQIANEGVTFLKMAIQEGANSDGNLFIEARLRALIVPTYKFVSSEQAKKAEQDFYRVIEDILSNNRIHTGAIWLKQCFLVARGYEYDAIHWLDKQVNALRETDEEANKGVADYLEFQAARLVADSGQLDEAQQRFQKMVTETQPNNTEARREFLRIGVNPRHEQLAQKLYEMAYRNPIGSQDRTDHAKNALCKNQRLIDADPDKRDVVPWTRHARLLLLLDERNESLKILNELLAKYPQDPFLWFHLGEAHYRQGVDEEKSSVNSNANEYYAHAITAFQEAWRITPRVATADQLAACLIRRENFEDAIHILAEAEKLDPLDGRIKLTLAKLYYQSGELDQALRLWLDTLQCFTQSEQQMDQRDLRLIKEAADAVVRFAEEPRTTQLDLDNIAPLALRALTSAASSAGWNKSKIIESIGAGMQSLPQYIRRRVPHALRAHLLYLQLAKGHDIAYQWHTRWYEQLSDLKDPKLLFEYVTGAKGVFRRAAVWSLCSSAGSHIPKTLTPVILNEEKWGKFQTVASTWDISENYYNNAYKVWPSGCVTCDELWDLVRCLNAKLFQIALEEAGINTNHNTSLVNVAKTLTLELEMLPANLFDPNAPDSVLVQGDELFSDVLLSESKNIINKHAKSEVKCNFAIENNLFKTSFYDGASVPPNEVDSLRNFATRSGTQVTLNDKGGITLGWPTSLTPINSVMFHDHALSARS